MPRETKEKICVGAVALIRRDNKVLLQLRKNCFGAGKYGLPGGHLEYMERLDEALLRELKEELDLNLAKENLRFAAIFDDPHDPCRRDQEHHIQVCFFVEIGNQIPRINEPNKCEKLEWFDIMNLPENILTQHRGSLELVRNGKIYDNKIKEKK